jgi:hypothetical protein
MQKGRGRRPGQTNKRRSNDEIRNDARETRLEEQRKERMQTKWDKCLRTNFSNNSDGADWKPKFIKQEHKSLIDLKGANPYFGKGGEADLKALSEIAEDAGVNYPPVLDDQAVEEPMEQDPVVEEEVDVNNEDNKELLPPVDMSRVPPSIFRQQIARVLADLRSRMLKKSPSNQHGCHSTGSADFPRESMEHNWPAPFTLKHPATFADFLLPQFGRLCFFAHGKVMPCTCCQMGECPASGMVTNRIAW